MVISPKLFETKGGTVANWTKNHDCPFKSGTVSKYVSQSDFDLFTWMLIGCLQPWVVLNTQGGSGGGGVWGGVVRD